MKAEALKQPSGLAFTTVIETNAELLPNLVVLVKDTDVKVRLAAPDLFERLGWQILPSYRSHCNKELLPLVVEVALHDEDMEVSGKALEGIAASGDNSAVEVLVKLLTSLTEEQYKGVVRDNVWTRIIDSGRGPHLRVELLRAYVKSDSIVRDRISRETANRYLG